MNDLLQEEPERSPKIKWLQNGGNTPKNKGHKGERKKAIRQQASSKQQTPQ